jgi:hypothetical protein
MFDSQDWGRVQGQDWTVKAVNQISRAPLANNAELRIRTGLKGGSWVWIGSDFTPTSVVRVIRLELEANRLRGFD